MKFSTYILTLVWMGSGLCEVLIALHGDKITTRYGFDPSRISFGCLCKICTVRRNACCFLESLHFVFICFNSFYRSCIINIQHFSIIFEECVKLTKTPSKCRTILKAGKLCIICAFSRVHEHVSGCLLHYNKQTKAYVHGCYCIVKGKAIQTNHRQCWTSFPQSMKRRSLVAVLSWRFSRAMLIGWWVSADMNVQC